MSCINSDESLPKRFTAADGSLVALADCDSFYASCERVARPDLAGNPVVVLSNNDGCIVAMSREAKKLGIPMGEPEFKVRSLLQKHRVAVFSSNYTLYGDLSHRVVQTLESVTPDVEVYSIDEAFLHLTGALAANAADVAALIRERVRRWVGLPISVGIAPTKVLAKIATEIAKRNPACHGIYDLSRCTDIDGLLERVPVADIWGIGRHSALKLKVRGIHTAKQLRDADTGMIRRLLTVVGLNILMELRGIPAIREEIALSHHSIISSRSLGRKVRELTALEEAVAFHASRAGEKLRGKRLLAGTVAVRIQTAYYAADQPQHDQMVQVRLPRPTADTAELIRAAHDGLRRIYRAGYGYAKALVMLLELEREDQRQRDLFSVLPGAAERDAKRANLMALMDRVNRTQGRGTLTFAAQGVGERDWFMKREMLSPCWTTDVGQLLRVRTSWPTAN